jgi:3-oxoacyl-[acyl-carrier-protein] synthase I
MTLTVRGLGLVSSVGRDLVTTCAALRAGISRPSPLKAAFGLDEESDGEPIVGSPISGLTDGFNQTGRWVRLALASLEDLLDATDDDSLRDPAFWNGVPVVWVMPALSVERTGWSPLDAPKILNDWCLSVLANLTQLPLGQNAENVFICEGQVGMSAALAAAERSLSSRRASHVLIIATDSWLDPMALRTLITEDRLKTAANPIGLRPGEAGACVLVRSDRMSGPRVRPALAHIDATAMSPVPLQIPAEGTDESRAAMFLRLGQSLSQMVETALQQAGAVPFRGDVIVDLNGEQWRAQAWGYAQVSLRNVVDWKHYKLIVPAVSIGDVGAVSAGIALGIATRSFARHYASSDRSLVCSISDNGKAASFVVRHPGARRAM